MASDEVASTGVGVSVLVGVSVNVFSSVNVSVGSNGSVSIGVGGDNVFFVVDVGGHWLSEIGRAHV